MTKSSNKTVVLRTLHYFWREIVKQKWASLGFFISTPLVIFIRGVLGPLVLAGIIGRIADGIAESEIHSQLLPQALIYLCIMSLSNLILEKLRLYWCWSMEIKGMYNLSSLAFNTISAQSMQFHSDKFSGSLVSQTNKFVSAFERFIDTIVWDILPLLSYLISTIVIIFNLAPSFAIFLIVFIIVYTIIASLNSVKIAKYNEKEASAQNKQTGQLSDSISNIIAVKSYAKEAYEKRRYARFQDKTYLAAKRLMFSVIKRDIMFSFVIISIMAVLLTFLIYGPVWFGIEVSTMVILANYSHGILSYLWDINTILRNYNRIFGDAQAMTLILDKVDDVVDEPGAKKLQLYHGAVSFNQITFKHHDSKTNIFQNFNLHIKPGERIGLVGASGSGKTTLTKLLLRFADVLEGQITIDEQDIRKITQKSLRENIAYVPQETALFHRTIAENIAYAKPNASMDEIIRAAKLANAHEFIKDLSEGYNTMVGERGIRLSGGQRQRIAIARAILKDAPILVLDEATSALDSESEALIQDALLKLMKGRTSIVIAHRLSTIASLDRIVVMENGKISEEGSHTELLAHPTGSYHKLWSKQSSITQ